MQIDKSRKVHFSLFLIIGKLNWETYKERLKPGRQKTNKLSRKFSNFQNNSIEMQSLQYLFSSQNSITNYQNFWTKFKHILRKKCKPQLHSGRKTTLPNSKIGSLYSTCHSISTCSATQWYFNSFVWCDNWLHIQMRVVWKHLVYLLLDIFLDRYPSYHFTKMAPGESCLKVRREGKGKGSDVLGRQWRNFCEKTNKSKPGWIMSILENPPPHFLHFYQSLNTLTRKWTQWSLKGSIEIQSD